MPNASIGVSAGPIRISQGIRFPKLKGLGIVSLLLAGPVYVMQVHDMSYPDPPPTGPASLTTTAGTTPDTSYGVEVGGFGPNLRAGEWQTVAPKKKHGHGCSWSVMSDDDSPTRGGKAKPGKKGTVRLGSGDTFWTEGCGTWVKV